MCCHRFARDCGSRPVVGSSMNSSGGSLISPSAMSRRRRCPPESVPHGRSQVLSRSSCEISARPRFSAVARDSPWSRPWSISSSPDERLRSRAAPLRDVTDLAPHGDGVSAEVVPGHRRGPGARRQQRREHPQRGRLAGPVRTEKADDLAGGNVDVDAANGLDYARAGGETLGQSARLDHIVKFEHADSQT